MLWLSVIAVSFLRLPTHFTVNKVFSKENKT